MSESAGPTPRAAPFYCPYCGEEDFVPYGDEPGGYLCNSCTRYWSLRFIGLGNVASSKEETDAV